MKNSFSDLYVQKQSLFQFILIERKNAKSGILANLGYSYCGRYIFKIRENDMALLALITLHKTVLRYEKS